MMLTKKALARRTFLRGVGVTMALPFLDAMAPAATVSRLSAASPAVRLGFVYVPNGIIAKGWLPATTGTGYQFASTMKPLEPFREKMLVLSNLMQNGGRALGDGAGDHARAGASWLTGVHPKKTGGADIHGGISADQVAARVLANKTQFGSLELGLEEPNLAGDCDSGYSCAYTNTVSWRTPTTPNPMEVNPRAVFERLFGDGETTDPASRLKLMKEDRSLLDFVRGDVARLQSTPGVGKRTAERIIVELREKVGVTLPEQAISISRGDDPRALAREALLGLGYTPAEADDLLDGADGERPEDLIAHALRSARG